MYEIFDGTAARVLLGIHTGDSIRRVSQRIQTPYETVRQAVNALETAGFVRYDDGLYVTDDRVRDATHRLLTVSARTVPPSIEDAYVIPHFADRAFAFTRIDAVYVWTHGGFQVSRGPDDYPLFLAVHDSDVEYWDGFFERYGIPTALERQPQADLDGPLQVVLEPRRDFESDWVEGYPVVPRGETIEYMQDHVAQFQSALSMLDRMYDDLDLDVAYRDSERAPR